MNNTTARRLQLFPEVNAYTQEQCAAELRRLYRTRSTTPERDALNLARIEKVEERKRRLEVTDATRRRMTETLRKGTR